MYSLPSPANLTHAELARYAALHLATGNSLPVDWQQELVKRLEAYLDDNA